MSRSAGHLLRRRIGRVRVLAVLTIFAIVVATVVLQLLISQALESSDDGLAQADTTLVEASRLASSTAGVADRIAELTVGVADGIGSSAQALDATQALAGSIVELIELLAAVSSRVRSVADGIAVTQQQLRDVQAKVVAAEQQVRATLPQLQASAATLRELPAQLDEARTGLAGSRRDLGPIGRLARIAVVVIAVVLAGLVLVTAESAVLRVHAAARSD